MPQRNVASNFTFEQQRVEINELAADFWTQKGTVDTAAPTYLLKDGSNAFTGATLGVPNAFTINSNSGAGTVTIAGNLQVDGTTTTLNSTTLEIADKNIVLAKGSANDAAADGAGITIDSSTDKTFNFVDADDAFVSSIGIKALGGFTGDGSALTGIPALTGSTNNTIVTVTGSNAIAGEANLTFNGSGDLTVKGNNDVSANLYLIADLGEHDGDGWRVGSNQDDNDLTFANNSTGSYVDKVTLTGDKLMLSVDLKPDTNNQRDFGTDNNRFKDAYFAGTVASGSLIISDDNALHFKGATDSDYDSILRESSGNALVINSRNDTIVNIDSNNDSTDAHFAVGTGAATASSTELFRIEENGRVGIGDVNPASLLSLKGSDPTVRFTNGTTLVGCIEGGTNNTYYGFNSAQLIFSTSTAAAYAPRMVINPTGQVLVSHDTSHADMYSKLQVCDTSSAGSIDLGRYTANEYPPYLNFFKSRAADINDNIVVQENDLLGYITFNGNDGAGFHEAASIMGVCDGEVATSGDTTDMPGRLVFNTVPDGSTTKEERMRIHSNGQTELKVPDANPALKITPIGTNANGVIDFNTPGTGSAIIELQGSPVMTIKSSGISDGRGHLRRITAVNPAGVYDVVAGDNGTQGRYILTSNNVRLVGGMTSGDTITIINNGGSDITIDAATNSVTLTNAGDASTGNRTLASKGMATVLYVGGSTAFITGAGLS